MAGDIGIREQLVILPKATRGAGVAGAALALAPAGGRIMHQYGERVLLAELPPGGETRLRSHSALAEAAFAPTGVSDDLTETERLGIDAFALRQSLDYAEAKANRPHQGASWDGTDGSSPLSCQAVTYPYHGEIEGFGLGAGAPALSARLTGKVAVGIVIIDGPTADLQFSAAERTKIVAEVQNGLGWLGAQNAAGAVSFAYEIHNPSITATPLTGSPTGAAMEDRFRDPAMQALGYGTGMGEVTKFANDLRTKLGTDWAYVGFFVKYPVGHFAYASIGGPRIVLQYANDGWGPDNIDRVFTHETGHIFGAPDEYAAAGCDCGGSWGYYGKPNINCATCAPGGGVKCLMKGNDWEMCEMTPYHLGFPLADERYSGVFRAGTGKYALWLNATYDSFIAKWQQWANEGLRLADLDIVQVGQDRRYNGVWVAGNDAYGLWLNADWDAFIAKWTEWSKAGLRLICCETVNIGGKNLYSGVFRAGTDAYGLWGNASWDNFTAKWQEWSKANLRLVDLTITNFGNDRRYTGVFRAGTDAYGLWVNADWNTFQAKWQEWSKANLRLIDLEVTSFGGERRYSGVFRGGSDGYGLWVNANFPSFKAKWEEWGGQGLRLVDVEVTDPANTVNAPVATGRAQTLALALGVEADENGGDGYGGIFLGGSSAGSDIDTGERFAGSTAIPRLAASDSDGGSGGMFPASAAPDTTGPMLVGGGDEGYGGMGSGDHDHVDSVASNGFGGGLVDPGGAEDGLGGVGGSPAEQRTDIDTGFRGG